MKATVNVKKQLLEVFYIMALLKMSQNSQEKTCVGVSFLNRTQVFSCEFCKKIFRTPFSKSTSQQLLLILDNSFRKESGKFPRSNPSWWISSGKSTPSEFPSGEFPQFLSHPLVRSYSACQSRLHNLYMNRIFRTISNICNIRIYEHLLKKSLFHILFLHHETRV